MNEVLTVSNTVNGLLFVILILGGYWVKNLQAELNELKETNNNQNDKIHDLELTLERDFTRKTALGERLALISDQLKRIETKLDEKADKP